MIEKYGREQVACIGTSQNFKLKSTVKDLLKLKGVDFSTANIITSLFSKEYDNASFEKIFDIARLEKKIKDIIKKYPEIVYEIYLMIFQPRSFGIHAAGVVIAPMEDSEGNKTTIHDYLPCRVSDDGQYVTEWEKEAVEEAGMLKEDILGLTQLDKIIKMNELIKKNGKEYKSWDEIDLDDAKILKLFKEAKTEDIFQFNTDVQKSYLLKLNADSAEDLVAANALNRPGAMESNSHNEFIKIKNGEREEKYPPLLKDILSNTRSLFCYQEHAMFAYQRITDCELEETDNFRKVISKSKPGKIDPNIEKYKENFINGYISKGISEADASEVWDTIIKFTSYSFNRSHAVAYALTGYWAAYYKAYFPMEFYTVSLEMASDDTLKRLISEIQSSNDINLRSPSINQSGTSYGMDFENNTIYWSLSSIKYAGDKAITSLLDDREKNGKYYSFEEFLERAKNFKVNKRIITNFIACGCFDEIENITEERDRYDLMKFYYEKIGDDIPQDIEQHKDKNKNHFWIMMQRQLCGLGNINYKQILKDNMENKWLTIPYMDPYLLQSENSIDKEVVVGGIVEEIIQRTTRAGEIAIMKLNCNNEIIEVTLWNDFLSSNRELITSSIFQPVLISGYVKSNNYKNINVLQSNSNTKLKVI